MDFYDKMHLRGKAEEDLFFARLDKILIDAMHEKQAKEQAHQDHGHLPEQPFESTDNN
ncbi:hypothetical protein [Photobacterium aquae]|uniref:hypothetical protein n=1 Tax=Photobacterium aquae TaxID=1195763 RepID=UPI000B0A7BBE|nr:hypothetical protein [Photobacterium aquae]